MNAPSQPSPTVGSYEVFRKIAAGRVGDLFLAKQIGLDGFEKLVVLRRIHDDLAADPEFFEALIEEARNVARLAHPNIVQLYDLGKDSEAYFMAIEYVPGRNLAAIAKKAKAKKVAVPVEYMAKAMSEVLAALHHAHTRLDNAGDKLEILHRGVTPRNVIVAFSGAIKLSDFGMTGAAMRVARKRTGVLTGRYEYMSPEQVHGSPLDARSDIFSVGVVLYEMLTGTNPFERDDDVETLNAIATENAPDCRLANPALSHQLAKILNKALEKRRGRRWKTAEEMQAALDDVVAASGKRCDGVTIARWVADLFGDELPSRKGSIVVAHALVDADEGRPMYQFDQGTAMMPPVQDKPTELIPQDDTTIQPKAMFQAARAAAAAMETEIAPFADLPTAALIETMEKDYEEVGFEVELSTLGEAGAEEQTYDPEEIVEGTSAKTGLRAPDPADLALARGDMVLETDEVDEEAMFSELPESSTASFAESTLDVGTADYAEPAKVLGWEGLVEGIEGTVEAEVPEDDHAISMAFEAFSIDDDGPKPKPKKDDEPEPEPLPLDAFLPEPLNTGSGPAQKGSKRNIVEVHRPGPAAPTQFLSGGADGELPQILEADQVTRLPEIVRERGGNTPPPALKKKTDK